MAKTPEQCTAWQSRRQTLNTRTTAEANDLVTRHTPTHLLYKLLKSVSNAQGIKKVKYRAQWSYACLRVRSIVTDRKCDLRWRTPPGWARLVRTLSVMNIEKMPLLTKLTVD